jgi:hypothetical protein
MVWCGKTLDQLTPEELRNARYDVLQAWDHAARVVENASAIEGAFRQDLEEVDAEIVRRA